MMLSSKHILITCALLLFLISNYVDAFGIKKDAEVVEVISEKEAEAVVAAAIEDAPFMNNLFPMISKLFQR